MSKIDPRLLARLQALDDPNDAIARALGICPTCGQPLPSDAAAKRERGAKGSGKTKAAVVEYMRQHPNASRAEVAEHVGVSATRISQVWREIRGQNGEE